MKLVGLEMGRVSLLVDLLEIGPNEGLPVRELVAALKLRYDFAVLPDMPTQEAPQKLLRFEQGRLPPGGDHIAYLEIHPQGLVVQGMDTRVCEAFFEDLFKVGKSEFGLRSPRAGIKKIYASSLVVDFETDMSAVTSRWR